MHTDILRRRSQAYQQVFTGPHGERVLADLKRYCRVSDTSFVPGDPHATSFSEGRRDVWNRIMAHIHLTDAQISDLPTEADNRE